MRRSHYLFGGLERVVALIGGRTIRRSHYYLPSAKVDGRTIWNDLYCSRFLSSINTGVEFINITITQILYRVFGATNKLVAPRSQVKPASFQHQITVRNETFYSEFHLSYSYTYGSLLLSHRGPDREIFDVVYDVLGWLLSSKIHSKTSFLKDIK